MLFLIILLPLFGFLGGCLFGRWVGKGIIFFTVFNILIPCILSLILLFLNFKSNGLIILPLNVWVTCGNFELFWELFGDNYTFIMVFVVTFISLLVHIYSSEYMEHDPHLQRFLSYLSLFTFFMLILVTASNFIQMFVGWEGVGLASYLLINFWFTRLQANKAAIKAMLFNRVADMLMILSLCTIYISFDTFDYTIIFSIAPLLIPFQLEIFTISVSNLDFICLFLFLGAMGKSAQLGFHNWLPDAMEGPTPVSALIHAATMVTAGIFLIIRASYLFELSNISLNIIAIIGALTALFGATTGLFFHDLKRVVAFSTCSQLGYMVMACGLERFNIAFFHLVTHAFFKALLFLTAGAIIHSMFDEQDIRKFGSLIKYLPITYISFLIGSLNLIGFPFLSGFYSKDLLLELVYSSYTTIGFFCYILGVLSIFFTSAYSTRILILIFLTNINFNRQYIKNICESNIYIRYSLIILCIASLFSGYLLLDIFCGLGSNFFGSAFFFNINNFNVSDIEFLSISIKILPLFITILGMSFSIYFYLINNSLLFTLKKDKNFHYIYYYLIKKWYSDRLVNETISLFFLKICNLYTYKKVDRGLLELFGPTIISYHINFFFQNNFFIKLMRNFF
jgi:NADH-ubiquinone oxidoreductase chain 5